MVACGAGAEEEAVVVMVVVVVVMVTQPASPWRSSSFASAMVHLLKLVGVVWCVRMDLCRHARELSLKRVESVGAS